MRLDNHSEWHGLTGKQWLDLWDARDWRGEVLRTLRAVATESRADPRDRLLALQVLNAIIDGGLVPPQPDYPTMMRDVFLEIAGGVKRGEKKVRKKMHARLLGARWMIETSKQFMPSPAAPQFSPTVDNLALS